MTWLARLSSALDRQDAILLVGLISLAVGLSLISLPLALVIVGVLLFALGVGLFVPRPGGKG